MKNKNYKQYNKKEMIKIIQENKTVYVETSKGNHYIINRKDIADFIILEAEKAGHRIEIYVYLPNQEEPAITTCGWFLNKCNPEIREEIINRLVMLQTTSIRPRKVKVFNTNILNKLRRKEFEKCA